MSVLESLPLIRLPESWPLPVVATLAMASLAALDLVGAYAAKEWAEQQNTLALLLGAALLAVARTLQPDEVNGRLRLLAEPA